MPYSYRITSRVLYSAQCHRHHCTLQAFEQFGALYMHSPSDKHPTQPGFEPCTSEFRTTTGRIEPSGPGILDKPYPTNTRHSPNAGFMLGQRRRRWTNIKPALVQCTCVICAIQAIACKHKTLNQCWFNVGLPSTTLGQHYPNNGLTPLFC